MSAPTVWLEAGAPSRWRAVAVLAATILLAPAAASAATAAAATAEPAPPPVERRPVAAARTPSMPSPETVERALAAVYPALVNIRVVSEEFSDGRALRYPSAGSGVVVSREGHVLTNYHVAGDSLRIQCALTSGEVLDAVVVAHDPLTDLSVLQIHPEKLAARNVSLTYAQLGDSGKLKVGDAVLAMGNPFALSSSVTLGIVSNPRRVFTDFTGTDLENMDLGGGQTTGIFTQWIQHDALILPGNSGGPLVNLQGEVVGINEMGGGGIGFAIPSRVAAEVLRQALAYGEVRRAWLGFTVLPVGRLGRTTGALVANVAARSPADIAGLKPGDYVTKLGTDPINVQFFEQVPELYQRVSSLPLGRPIELTIERDGQPRALVMQPSMMERTRGAEAEFHDLGLTLSEITGPMVLARQLPVADGLLVTGVRASSPAASSKPQLAVGDVLVKIGGQPVRALGTLREILAKRDESDLLVALRRGEEELLSLIHPDERRGGRSGGELPKAWLGIKTQVLTPELAAALGESGTRGYRVSEVFPWTEASRAGLQVGDLLLALDGQPLDATRPQDADDLRRAVEERSIGDTVRLKERREGVEGEVVVKLEARPIDSQEARSSREEDLEFSVRELTLLDRIRFRWQRDQKGVLVTDISQGGWAQVAGLKVDDLVMTIGGHPVDGVEGFQHAMNQALAESPCLVRLFVRRGFRTHFVFIEPQGADTACPAISTAR